MKLAAGRARGALLQILAVVCAILGLVAAKYFIFTHFFSQGMAGSHPDVAAGYFSLASIVAFFMNFSSFLSPFDLLWVILAIGAAWSGPKAIRVVAG